MTYKSHGMNIYGVDKMWKDKIKKQLQPANKMHAFAFRTPVDFNGEDDLKGDAIIEWEFSFGQRETYMREVGVYVTKVILPDETELSDKEIENLNSDTPDIIDKTGPSELYKYDDGDYELIWN